MDHWATEAATVAARRVGLQFDRAELVADDPNGIVRLLPGPVVARVTRPEVLGRGDASVASAVAVASHAARSGAPVTSPTSVIDPGPHVVGDMFVSFWQWAEDGGAPDPSAAGRTLRQVHDALGDFPHGSLPLAHLDEVRALIAEARPSVDVTSGDLSLLMRKADEVTELIGRTEIQAIHGDAHLGNVVWSPDGPVWADWEMACAGPRELDLAALIIRDRTVGPTAGVREALAGYGTYDSDLVEQLVQAFALMTTAWMLRVHEVSQTRVPAEALRKRMMWWRKM